MNGNFQQVFNRLNTLTNPFKGANNAQYKILSAVSSHLEVNFLEQLKIVQKILVHYSFILTLRTHCSKRIYANLQVLFMIFLEIYEEYQEYKQEIQNDFIEFLIFRLKNSKNCKEKVEIVLIVKKLREIGIVSEEFSEEAKNVIKILIEEKIKEEYFIYDQDMSTSIGFFIFQKLFDIVLPDFKVIIEIEKIIDDYVTRILKYYAKSSNKANLLRNSLSFISSIPKNIIFSAGLQGNIDCLSQFLFEQSIQKINPEKKLQISTYSPVKENKEGVINTFDDLINSITMLEPYEPFDSSSWYIILSHKDILLKRGLHLYSNFVFKEFIEFKNKKLQSIYNEIKCYEETSKISDTEPAFIKCFGTFITNTSLVLVLEYGGDTLESQLLNLPKTENSYIQIMQNLASALTRLKFLNIFHCDIKPNNILLNPETLQVKIIDYGVSLLLKPGQDYRNSMFKVRGTVSYCSPQIYQCLRSEVNVKDCVGSDISPTKLCYDPEKADVFSLGLIFAELALKKSFKGFNTPEKHQDLISSIQKIRLNKIKELVRDMVCLDPVERPEFEEITKKLRSF
jgi:tRNA A-37 threonylcarbamoyl transferase component Bud32